MGPEVGTQTGSSGPGLKVKGAKPVQSLISDRQTRRFHLGSEWRQAKSNPAGLIYVRLEEQRKSLKHSGVAATDVNKVI